ncbi:MAG: 16S rRNA (cytidine(1402)-2'-O)-methyltransferase [Rhodospirillales bacterium]|nr:16S rRNA (cytidine(1402)-2'-O)-methyltransferase [Rhodospirillales bacterium]
MAAKKSSPRHTPPSLRQQNKAPGEPNGEADGSKRRENNLQPGLYLVATPIGNAADLSLRAIRILSAVDIIAAEDTRVTGQLLKMHGIEASMVPYHDHNAEGQRPKLIERIKNGEMVALVSDAGTPAIADPGYKLVRDAIENGLAVTSAPGANAGLTALILSGLPTDRFLFEGYLPNRAAARRKILEELSAIPATLIFYESAKRLAASLSDMAHVLGGRSGAVARELTKLYEEVRRGNLIDLAAHYAQAGAPKGEIVIVVARPGEAPAPAGEALDQIILAALKENRIRDAATIVAAETGFPRRDIYNRALELKDDDG